MTERSDREFLLSIFLVEAWDTAGALEDGLGRLSAGGDGAVASLLVLAHRLKGSAALHGLPGLSELAAAAETELEQGLAASPREREQMRRRLGAIVVLVKDRLDRIGSGRGEDAERAGDSAGHIPHGAAAGGVAEPETAADVFRDLDRFFAEGGEVVDYFGQEAGEHLEAMTASLLALERAEAPAQELAALFRAAHTLKGAAYTVGCGPVGDLAHRIEDVLVEVREGRAPLSAAATEAILGGVDALRLMLRGPAAPRAELAAALARAHAGLSAAAAPTGPVSAGEPAGIDPAGAPEPMEDMQRAQRALAAAASEIGRAPARARAAGARPGAAAREAAASPAGPSIRVRVDRLDSLMNLVGELMIARSRLDRRLEQLDRVSVVLRTTRARMDRAARDFERRHPSSTPLAAGAHGEGAGAGPAAASIAEVFAELEFDRYDATSILVRSIGELCADVGLVEAQHAATLRAVREDVAHVQRLTGALRKEVARARMVPIGRVFSRFARPVREAARAAGKRIALETHGGAVEVDNSIVEQVGESLLHVVQNAIVHGIEPEAERRARGKPSQGTVSLRAYQQGAFIFVEVEDDGGGMDAEGLRARAIGQGLCTAPAARALSDAEAVNLIFLPGFSTAASVTQAAGRGVGLDVVRTNVSRLNGEIEVETEVGVRTRFTFKLPLTVAIADALMVRAGGLVLAIPLTTVGIMRFVEPAALQSLGDREMVELDNQVMELIRLDRILGLGRVEAPPGRVPVVVLRAGGLPFAVAVDELIGKEEIVIKSLGDFLEGVGPFAGATISGDGRVILLVDPTQLFELSRAAGDGAGAGRVAADDERAAARAAAPAILLVDDSISVRRFVGQMLERAGFVVSTAVDGQDALEQLAERTVDAVITDLEMPRVNGYTLIEDLRRRPATRAVPVVVLTTRAGDKHKSLARRLGVRHYVAKPVEEGAFVALIRSVLSAAPTEAVLAQAGSDRP